MQNSERGKVLFVDDEHVLLELFEEVFSESEFDVFTANSGAEALEFLEHQPINLIISDIKMPEMDGFAFLKKVKKKWPDIIRVMLTGYANQESVLEALTTGVATTYLVKPWNNEDLEKTIIRLLNVRNLMKNQELLDMMNGLELQPANTMVYQGNRYVYQEFMAALPRVPTYQEFADIINQDPALAAKILHIANSSYYGGLQEVSSVEHAISIVGLNVLQEVVTNTTLSNAGSLPPSLQAQFDKITEHSSKVNKYIGIFYQSILGKELNDNYTSVGSTHDIGKFVLLQHFPDRFKKIMGYQEEHPELSFYQCELHLGFQGTTHCEIGAYLLDLWNLPQVSIETAMLHHTFNDKLDDSNEIIHVTKVVNYLVAEVERASNASDEEGQKIHLHGLEFQGLDSSDLRRFANRIRLESKQEVEKLGARA